MGVMKFDSEADFQAFVLRYAKLWGWRCYHTADSRRSQAGFPDLVLVRTKPPGLLFLELKSETGRVSAEQAAWLAALEAAGQTARVVRPSQWDELAALLGG